MSCLRMIVLMVCLSFGFVVRAEEPSDSERGKIKALMHTFVMEISNMSPYLTSTRVFESENGKKTVKASLDKMLAKMETPPKTLTKSAGFEITFDLLSDHVQKTKQVFERGEMDYARMRVAGITNLCAACHMQNPVPKPMSPFAAFDAKSGDVNFANANFFFLIRRWDLALTQFEKLIRGYPESGATSEELSEVFRKRLAIYARVLRAPKLGALALQEDLKNPKLPSDIRANVTEWIESLNKLAEEPRDVSDWKTPKLIEYVVKKMPTQVSRKIPTSDPNLIKMLYLSGLLYERLFKEPDGPQTPELLYHLSMAERSLAPVIWYSISEVYLKECVVRYPKKPITKKCFNAYEEGMQERFVGRKVPEPVRESIEALRSYL